MLVFSPKISRRLEYIFDFIGKELTGKALEFTNNKDKFFDYAGIKVNYSETKITDLELWLAPSPLLFETGIREQQISCFEWNDSKAFFKTGGDFPFDIFAATFYLLSRYEEYLPHQKDLYGRFAHTESLAFKEGFLHLPLINNWLQLFRDELKKINPEVQPTTQSFKWLPTYDIDEAYSFKHKSGWRTLGSSLRDLLKGNFKRVQLRRKVVNGTVPDPFDSYEWMDALHLNHQLHPQYFFLVAEQNGKYDKNILPAEPALRELIKKHADTYSIGVHPSWQSGDDQNFLRKEIDTIASLTQQNIHSSRQHFIRFNLPGTYRHLISNGITEDFSMGYGSINGFRASVASPFYWYDLENETTTSLQLFPFCFMEANSFYEQHQTPQQAFEEMKQYYQSVKAVNGLFITIWHNTFLGTDEKFKGWREVYERFVKEIAD